MWGAGVGLHATEKGLQFQGEADKIDDTYLIGKLAVENYSFVEHFKFAKQFRDDETVAKQTIPAPAQFLEQFIMPMNIQMMRRFYADDESLIADVAAGYKKVIADLYTAGMERIKDRFLTINNLAIEGKSEDMVINTRICRGNWVCSGPYDARVRPRKCGHLLSRI